jgi:universal stress protein E
LVGDGRLGGEPADPALDASLRDAINDAQQEAFDELAERYGIEQKRRHLEAGILIG